MFLVHLHSILTFTLMFVFLKLIEDPFDILNLKNNKYISQQSKKSLNNILKIKLIIVRNICATVS